MKQKLLFILVSILLSMAVITLLNYIPKTLKQENHVFYRKFPPHFLSEPKITVLENKNPYILGMDGFNLYLGHSFLPLNFSQFQYHLSQLQNDSIILKTPYPIAWQLLKKTMIGNKLYLYEGLTPNVIEYRLSSKNVLRKEIDSLSFVDCLPVSDSKVIIKTFDAQRKQQVLARLTLKDNNLYIPQANLEKQVDGFFCTDGHLQFSEDKKYITYTYRYRNEFLVFDSNLKLLRNHNTIDPHYKADIEVAKVKRLGREKIKLASVPKIVNRQSFSQGPWLFINSNIIAKNEVIPNFRSKSVIDIYGLGHGTYKYSFYVPSYQGEKMKDFAFYNNTLAVVYSQGIGIFKMNLNPVTDL